MPQIPFSVGDIVTLKSHPLFYAHGIDIFSNQVPPLMLIKDVFFENDKKKVFSTELAEVQIADKIKYTCIYFNNNKSEFVEATLYHSFLRSYRKLLFERQLDEKGKETKSAVTLIDEVETYTQADYKFGKVVQFKTNKLERRKVFHLNDNALRVSYTSPDFILCGYKAEPLTDMFYGDGQPKRKASGNLVKVMWYNFFQQKFSEHYLPQEFFIEKLVDIPKQLAAVTSYGIDVSGNKEILEAALNDLPPSAGTDN